MRPGARELDDVMRRGAAWMVEQGFGTADDLEHLESGGCIPGADPDALSLRAKQRGQRQHIS